MDFTVSVFEFTGKSVDQVKLLAGELSKKNNGLIFIESSLFVVKVALVGESWVHDCSHKRVEELEASLNWV